MGEGLTPEEEAELAQIESELAQVEQPAPQQDRSDIGSFLGDVVAPIAEMGDLGKLGSAFAKFPGQVWDAGKGAVSEVAGGFPATRKYYNEHGLIDTFTKGAGGVARMAGSIATGPFAPITDQLINKTLQRIDPEVFPETTVEQDAEAMRSGVAGSALTAGAIGAAKGARGIYRAINPSSKEIAFRAAQMEGSSAAPLNAPKGTTMKEGQIVRDIMPKEDVFLQENPAAGINTKGLDGQINAYPQFQQNISNIKSAAHNAKATAITKLEALPGPGVVITNKGLSPLAVANGLSDDATNFALSKVNAELVDVVPYNQAVHSQYPMQLVNYKPMAFVPKKLTPSQIQQYIKGIDDELERIGAFDDTQLAKLSTDPSYAAQIKPQVDGLFFLRRTMGDKLVEYATQMEQRYPQLAGASKDIIESNAKISAMIEYENLAKRFQTDMLQGMTPGSGKSLGGIGGANPFNRTNLLDRMTGGAVGALGEKQMQMRAMMAGSKAVEALQNWSKYAGGRNMPWEMVVFNNLPSLQTSMGLGAALPRDTRSIDGDGNREEMFMNTARSLGLVDPETRYSDLPEPVRQQMLEIMVGNVSGAFERTPDGYQGVVNGKFVNPMEKDMHLKSALDKKLPLEQEAEVVGGLLQENRYVPLNQPTSTPRPVITPKMNVDDFSSALDIPMLESSPGVFESDAVSQLENMTRSRSRINFERSGL